MKSFKFHRYLTFIMILSSLFLYCPPEIRDDIAPTVFIMHPINNQVVSGNVKITVGASDNKEVDKIELQIDGSKVKSAPGDYLEYIWDTRPIADNRDHSLFATATDKDGNNGFSGSTIVRVLTGDFPDTLAPTITLLNPVNGSSVANSVQIVPQITDDSPILKVDYYVDGVLFSSVTEAPFEYSWDVTEYINGSNHSIFARAYDINENNSVSNTVTVTIQNEDNIPPTVTILYPASGTSFTEGETITINVDAQDNNAIQKVEFYIDGDLKTTDTSRPYLYSWNTTGLGDGRSHTIYVKAFDFAGNVATQLLTVTINP